jgi:amino acid transporter
MMGLGLGISLGGSLIGWNAGLVEGFWVYFTSYVIVGIGYLCLVLCLAELTSIMAFAGGAYGYIRCSVSPFLGYLLGCCEWLQNNMFVISCVSSMGFAITEATRQPLAFEILDYFIIYLFLLMFHIRGGRYFWMAMSTCAILTTAVILLYILAAFTADPNFFHTNITTDERYRFKTDNGGHIFHELYLPCWFFIGCETLTIAGAKIANVSAHHPHAACVEGGVIQ